MTNYRAGVSEKGNRIIPGLRANKKRKETSITTVRDQYLSFATFSTPLVSNWSLPLNTCFNYKTLLVEVW
jgi:hypothetical protein